MCRHSVCIVSAVRVGVGLPADVEGPEKTDANKKLVFLHMCL